MFSREHGTNFYGQIKFHGLNFDSKTKTCTCWKFGLLPRIVYTKHSVTTGSTLPWVLGPLSWAHASSTPDGSTPCRSPAIIIRYIDTCVPPQVVLSFIHDHVFIHQSVSEFGPPPRPDGPPFPLNLHPCARSAICIREILSFRSVDGFFRGYDGRTPAFFLL